MKTNKNIRKIEVLKPTGTMLRSNKKGFVPIIMAAGVITILGLAGTGSYALYKHFTGDEDVEAKTLTTVKLGDKTVQVVEDDDSFKPLLNNNCGSTGQTETHFTVINPLDKDGISSYPVVALQLQSEGSKALSVYTTTGSADFASSPAMLNCGREFTVYALAAQNSTASHKWEFEAKDPLFNEQLEVEPVDYISVSAFDKIKNKAVYDASDADAEDKEELTSTVTFKSSVGNTTPYAMGADDDLSWKFHLKVNEAQKAWGDLTNWVVIKAATTDFGTPKVALDSKGLSCTTLAESDINANDKGYLAGYTHACKLVNKNILGQETTPIDITSSLSIMDFDVSTKPSIDADEDIDIRFVAESFYKDGTTVKKGIFNAGGQEILTGMQKITIDIS